MSVKSSIVTIYNRLFNRGNTTENSWLKEATTRLFDARYWRRNQLYAKLDAFEAEFKALPRDRHEFFAGGHRSFFVLLRKYKGLVRDFLELLVRESINAPALWSLAERFQQVTKPALHLSIELYTDSTYDSTPAGKEFIASINEELPGVFDLLRQLREATLDHIDAVDPGDTYRFSALFVTGPRIVTEFTPEHLLVDGVFSKVLVRKLVEDTEVTMKEMFAYCSQRDHLACAVVIVLGPSAVTLLAEKPVGDDTPEGAEEREAFIESFLQGLVAFQAKPQVEAYTGMVPNVAQIHSFLTGPQRSRYWLSKQLAEAAAAHGVQIIQDDAFLAEYYEKADHKGGKLPPVYCLEQTEEGLKVVRGYWKYSSHFRPFAVSVPGTLMPGPNILVARSQRERAILARTKDGKPLPSLRSLVNLLSTTPPKPPGSKGFATYRGGVPEFRFLRPRSASEKPEKPVKIATYDIETVTLPNGSLAPYMIGFYHTTLARRAKGASQDSPRAVIEHAVQFTTTSPQLSSEQERICEEAADYIAANYCGYKLFAHRAFSFDYLFLAKPIVQWVLRGKGGVEEANEQLTFRRNRENLVSVKTQFHTDKPPVIFLDSYNFIKMSLNSAGRTFVGGEKDRLPQALSIAQITPAMLKDKKHLELLAKYNLQDCRLLFQVLRAYEREIYHLSGLSAFKSYTQVGLSYRIFLRFSQGLAQAKIVVPDRTTASIVRAAFRGGRTEVLHHYAKAEGDKKIYFLDYTSLYPAAAYYFPQPSGYVKRLRPATVRAERYKGKLGVYYCRVVTPKREDQQPFLPIRYGAEVVVPEGEFYSTYTSIEVDYARSIGYTMEVIDGVYFSDRSFVLDTYIEKIYQEKRLAEASGPVGAGRRAVAKLLLNALIGRFAQRQEALQTQVEVLSHVHDKGGRNIRGVEDIDDDVGLVSFSDIVQPLPELTVEGTEGEIAPQITAFITARARIMLHQAMSLLQKDWAATIHYVDTDSIAFSTDRPFDLTELTSKLEPSTNPEGKAGCPGIGQLVPVYKGEVITEAQFIAPKVYRVVTDQSVYTKTAGFVPAVEGLSGAGAQWEKLMKALLKKGHTVTAKEVELPAKGGIRQVGAFAVQSYSGGRVNLLPHLLKPSRRALCYSKDGDYLGTTPVNLYMVAGRGVANREQLMTETPIPTGWFKSSPEEAAKLSETASRKPSSGGGGTLQFLPGVPTVQKRGFSTQKKVPAYVGEEKIRLAKKRLLESIEGSDFAALSSKGLDREEGRLRYAKECALERLTLLRRRKISAPSQKEEREQEARKIWNYICALTGQIESITATEVLPAVCYLRLVELLRTEYRKVKFLTKDRPAEISVKLYLPVDDQTRAVCESWLSGGLLLKLPRSAYKYRLGAEGLRFIFLLTVKEVMVPRLIEVALEEYKKYEHDDFLFHEESQQPE